MNAPLRHLPAQRRAEAWFSPTGRLIVIRPVQPGDLAMLDALAHRLSALSRCQRFQLELWQPLASQVDRLVRLDCRHEAALVALAPTTGGPVAVGEARYMRVRGAAAEREFALAVADSMQGQGLGVALLRRLIADAERAGIERLYCDVRPDNQPMLRLAARLGIARRSIGPDRRVRLELDLGCVRALPVARADLALAGQD